MAGRVRTRSLLFLGAMTLVACQHEGAETRTAADFDRPVPAGEPRAELSLELDLEPASDCEERFDLALYRDRAIDLIAWDDGDGCGRRSVRIRYLSRQTKRDRVLAAVRELAREVRTTASERDTSGSGSSPARGEAHRNEETK